MTTVACRRTLHDWFAASAASYPGHTALEVGGEVLTYAGLAAAAQRVAAGIVRRLDGRIPHRVGLLASRSITAYAGYLAAQRLGATVVPLGTAFPAARNAAVVRAADVDLVVADEDGPSADLGVPLWRPGRARQGQPTVEVDALPPAPADGDDLAYILFTSGSTGTPKGVPVRHRNICAHLEHVVPRCDAGPGARLSQTFDLTFDPSVLDMFAAWGSGAALVVPTRDEVLTPVRFVNDRGITHWNSVPSVITIAGRLRALTPHSMPGLRRSMFCGEPLTLQQARAWKRAAPAGAIENGYGPTELTVTCLTYRLPPDEADWPAPANGTVPIGEPHRGTEVHLRDGELCVRGAQRFAGYLDPSDNAGRFLTPDGSPYDPATVLTDAHWYRTGDRVVRGEPAATGPLVHVGRLDTQVQVHGYRVETAEVEAALREQPGVADAVVVALTATTGTRLVAAFSGAGAEPDRLRAALRERLPGYMVPDTLTAFPALPLNANGKIDRAAVHEALAHPGIS
ncbi:D-alanine--poly(phosphoribitol) ligase [Streptomyces solincola]|uniref:D-alanine--poly(Phosphoribitol) ligase n=1 Tax=Streptomyces solincola TaxID=2100817 RepID=A0A2S9PTZ4_9ACTN|nr:AMP-binding protein [Streptomyces solincola]PRH77896.1 D-alanine--poly(phosphoribitol) ligase [Streptomyces solincola]